MLILSSLNSDVKEYCAITPLTAAIYNLLPNLF